MLLELTPRQRVAIVNRYYLGLTEKETARAMGCTIGTVKTLNSRGLSALRRQLAALDDEADVGHEQPAQPLRKDAR